MCTLLQQSHIHLVSSTGRSFNWKTQNGKLEYFSPDVKCCTKVCYWKMTASRKLRRTRLGELNMVASKAHSRHPAICFHGRQAHIFLHTALIKADKDNDRAVVFLGRKTVSEMWCASPSPREHQQIEDPILLQSWNERNLFTFFIMWCPILPIWWQLSIIRRQKMPRLRWKSKSNKERKWR